MLEQELFPSYQGVQRLARRGTNAWAYGALMCVFMVGTLSAPCCFLINFSNPLTVAKDGSNGSLDSTREQLAGASWPSATPGLFPLPLLTRCESALENLCLPLCGNWVDAAAPLCRVCVTLPESRSRFRDCAEQSVRSISGTALGIFSERADELTKS